MRKKFKNYSDFIEYFRSFKIDKLEKSEDIFFVYGIMKDLLLNYELPFEDRELISGIVTKLEARFKELNIFMLTGRITWKRLWLNCEWHLSDEDIAQIILTMTISKIWATAVLTYSTTFAATVSLMPKTTTVFLHSCLTPFANCATQGTPILKTWTERLRFF